MPHVGFFLYFRKTAVLYQIIFALFYDEQKKRAQLEVKKKNELNE